MGARPEHLLSRFERRQAEPWSKPVVLSACASCADTGSRAYWINVSGENGNQALYFNTFFDLGAGSVCRPLSAGNGYFEGVSCIARVHTK